jgi:hypothetical protein
MRDELEVPLNQIGYVVGVNSDYPARLREMLSAAAITYQLANSSIDHVRRTYLKGMTYEDDPGGAARIDRTIRKECTLVGEAVGEFLRQYPRVLGREPLVGEWAGDLAFLRIAYSIERAFAEADKGALYESVVISRMALEQCCWAWAVRNLDEVEDIARLSVGHCVTLAKRDFPQVGRLYGWMSRHAHWNHSAHLKAITTMNGRSAVLLSSSWFKALAYCLLIVLSDAYREMVGSIVFSLRQRAFNSVRSEWSGTLSGFKPRRWMGRLRRRLSDSEDAVELYEIFTLSRPSGVARS